MLMLVLLTAWQGSWAEDASISSAGDWQAFANRVNAGLTQDVDLRAISGGNATENRSLNSVEDDVVAPKSTESDNREIYIAYDGDVATYFYDDQRASHSLTGNPSKGPTYCPSLPNEANLPRKVVIDPSFADARPTIETCGMFYFGVVYGQHVEEIEGLEYLNTSEATDFTGMFARCQLAELDLSSLDTRNVVSMESMFYLCDQLEEITFGHDFNTQKVTSMSYMFYKCEAMRILDISTFDTHHVTTTAYMFGECGKLTTVCVDANKWDMSNMVEEGSFDHMFTQCKNIVGAQGTSWANEKNWSVEYAQIDGGTSAPGYLWDVNDSRFVVQPYVVYDDNSKTMTFQNNQWRVGATGEGITAYDLGTDEKPTWYDLLTEETIEQVEFLPEFAEVRPTTTQMWFKLCTKLREIKGLEYLNTSEVTTMRNMFGDCSLLTSIDVSGFDTRNVTSMFAMFSGCSSLTSLDLSNFNTDKVTDMYAMFSSCSGLTSLDLGSFNTEKVTDMESMFSGCSGLTTLDLSNFNTANVTSIKGMFRGCSGLKSVDLSSFNTEKITGFIELFLDCNSLETLDLSSFNTERVTTMSRMFNGCSSLKSVNLSSFNTANVTNMYSAFHGCTSLKELDLTSFNTSRVTSMIRLFYNCQSLEVLDLSSFNTANVTSMSEMFYNCTNLKTIYVGDNFDTAALGNTDQNSHDMFKYCSAIVGGNGTVYQGDSFEDHAYAVIDGENGKEGYFTSIYDLGYAVYDDATKTMTFYSDLKRDEHTEGTSYGLKDDWYIDLHFLVNKVVFDPSFAKARPQSMAAWFADFFALTAIEGWENLNTSRATSINDMFFGCHNLTTLDLSRFDLTNVTNRKNMLYELQPDVLLYLPSGMKASDFEGTDNGGLVHESYNLVLDEDGDGQYHCADLRLADIKDFALQGTPDERPADYQIVTPFHADKALYERTFTASRRSTIYLPFAFSASQFGTVYSFDGELMARGKGIRFFPVESAATEANTPYIIDPNGTAISASDVDVEPWTATEPSGSDEMIGVVSRSKVPQGAYCYDAADGRVKRVANSSVNISAGRAYFLLPSLAATGAKSLIASFEDDTADAILPVGLQQIAADGDYYSLDGQRISGKPAKKGVYIHNGHKIVVK